MKTLLISALFSFSALACPKLGGTYKNCHAIAGADIEYAEFSITQKFDGIFHTFYVSSIADSEEGPVEVTYHANGELYEQNVDNTTYTTQSSCSDNELTVISTVSDQYITMRMSKEGQKLVQKINGHVMGTDFSSVVVCE